MSLLVLTSGNTANPLTVDLSAYVHVDPGGGLDPADPAFTQRLWSRSLLKTGATLALEQLVEKEMQFPLRLGPVGGAAGAPQSLSATLTLIAQINQILETPGSVLTWQPPGASQPTYFDILSGLVESQYNYRANQQSWEIVNLRVFTQPLGRTAAPRVYATASGVGPLLMISPYASSGAQAIGASTQAGVAGYGGQQQGASSGVFYWGSPSLAGDAPIQLQVSYTGPLPNTATSTGTVPYVAVSLLPDSHYQPLLTSNDFNFTNGSPIHNSTAVASQYCTVGQSDGNGFWFSSLTFSPIWSASSGIEPVQTWAGNHRLFAIARASAVPGSLQTLANSVAPFSSGATVYPGADWGLYDLGVFSIRPSQPPQANVQVVATNIVGVATTCAIDVTALVMLPDSSTWFLNPTGIQGSQYGYPQTVVSNVAAPVGPYTNTLLLDDTLGDQFIYATGSQSSAPSPTGMVSNSARMTQFSRGLIPTPDPKNGLPIIAILGVAQNSTPSTLVALANGGQHGAPGASWPNAQNLRTMAQVNVLERTRYVLS